jgi:2-aminoadipate transaminase
MVASEIRALFAVASRPEIVSLAGGSPFVSALPLYAVGEMVGRLIASRGQDALQYCTAQGDMTLREQICEVMSLEGIRAHPGRGCGDRRVSAGARPDHPDLRRPG